MQQSNSQSDRPGLPSQPCHALALPLGMGLSSEPLFPFFTWDNDVPSETYYAWEWDERSSADGAPHARHTPAKACHLSLCVLLTLPFSK